jgi:hypothetical protein
MLAHTTQAGRRNFLRLSPFAAGAASTAIGRVSLAQAPAATMREAGFNVHAYGATGDGKTVDTPAINRAIEAVAAAGGGTLVFPAGTPRQRLSSSNHYGKAAFGASRPSHSICHFSGIGQVSSTLRCFAVTDSPSADNSAIEPPAKCKTRRPSGVAP